MSKFLIQIKKTLQFFVAAGVMFASPAIAQQELSIESQAMQREIVVHLPKNYDADREDGYPVIYMLDAGLKDKLTAEIASYYNWGEIMPEVIVIGLKSIGRGLDFLPHYFDEENDGEQVSGNGGKLLAYIETELIPFANNQFNTNGNNAFAGHSWGGQYLTYALSQSPGLFDAYFITSPSFGYDEKYSKETFDKLKHTLGQDLDLPDFIYVSVGGDEPARRLSDYYRLTALLKQYLREEVKLYNEIHDSAVHRSNGAISIPKAMQLYFATSPEAG